MQQDQLQEKQPEKEIRQNETEPANTNTSQTQLVPQKGEIKNNDHDPAAGQSSLAQG